MKLNGRYNWKNQPERLVVIDGYEGGYESPERLKTIRVDLDVNTESYYGSPDYGDSVEVAYLPRESD